MEEKELKTPKHCLNCQYHETFYTKCAVTFYREKRGYCMQRKELTENHDTCEEWTRKSGKGRSERHKHLALKVLTKISSDISLIAQILVDDKKDEEESK